MLSSTHQGTIAFVARPEIPRCARVMAFWLAFGLMNQGRNHPTSAAEVACCLDLLRLQPELRRDLPAMASVSPEWSALVADWSRIETAAGPQRAAVALRPTAQAALDAVLFEILNPAAARLLGDEFPRVAAG